MFGFLRCYVHDLHLCNTSKEGCYCLMHLFLSSPRLFFICTTIISGRSSLSTGKLFRVCVQSLLEVTDIICPKGFNYLLACSQGLHFQRNVEDTEKWLEGVENDLKTPYNDNDLVVLNSHLKKQEELEEDIAAHRDRLQELVATAQQFQKEKHFLADELEEKVDELVQRCVSAWPVPSLFYFYQLFFNLNILFSFFLYTILK